MAPQPPGLPQPPVEGHCGPELRGASSEIAVGDDDSGIGIEVVHVESVRREEEAEPPPSGALDAEVRGVPRRWYACGGH